MHPLPGMRSGGTALLRGWLHFSAAPRVPSPGGTLCMRGARTRRGARTGGEGREGVRRT